MLDEIKLLPFEFTVSWDFGGVFLKTNAKESLVFERSLTAW